MHDQTTTGHTGGSTRAPGRDPVAVLAASVLTAARLGRGESREDFSARADIDLHVVEGVEDRTIPAWDLPYATFTALGEAVSAWGSWQRAVFEAAAACDLVLTCVMRGDRAFSTDVLADDETRDLAVGLLRWAATGEFRLPGSAGCTPVPVLWAWQEECGGWACPACGSCSCQSGSAGCGHRGQLLDDVDLEVLRSGASALARSMSLDAWVGAEILGVLGGVR
jgi:hypothetical protein